MNDGAASELRKRAEAIASRAALSEEPPEPVAARPLQEPGGFIDVVFTTGEYPAPVFVELRDPKGNPTERGHWLEGRDQYETVLRLPCPNQDSDPTIDAPPAQPHVPAGDQVLARADELLLPRSGTVKARVLGTFSAWYRQGKLEHTDYEIAAAIELGHGSIGPRRHELVEGGWLEATGNTVAGPSGSTDKTQQAKTWRLTGAAVERLGLRRP